MNEIEKPAVFQNKSAAGANNKPAAGANNKPAAGANNKLAAGANPESGQSTGITVEPGSPPEALNQKEINGPRGLEPTRYGDWESKGRCHDF